MEYIAFLFIAATAGFLAGGLTKRRYYRARLDSLKRERRITLAVLGHVLPEGWSGMWRSGDLESYMERNAQCLYTSEYLGTITVAFKTSPKIPQNTRPLPPALPKPQEGPKLISA